MQKPIITGTKVREARLERRMSQNVFAALAGIGQSTVSLWERGLIRPSLNIQLRVLDFLEDWDVNRTPPVVILPRE